MILGTRKRVENPGSTLDRLRVGHRDRSSRFPCRSSVRVQHSESAAGVGNAVDTPIVITRVRAAFRSVNAPLAV